MSKNFFEIFDLPILCNIDIKSLDKIYFSILKEIHPDNDMGSDETTKSINTQKSMLINEAYDTLKNPIKRIFYLLKLKNIDISEQSEIRPNSELLKEMFEIREILSNIDDVEQINQFKDNILNQIQHSINDFNNEYISNVEMSINIAIKIKYLSKILEEIKAKQ